jgi:hypothetical protein
MFSALLVAPEATCAPGPLKGRGPLGKAVPTGHGVGDVGRASRALGSSGSLRRRRVGPLHRYLHLRQLLPTAASRGGPKPRQTFPLALIVHHPQMQIVGHPHAGN